MVRKGSFILVLVLITVFTLANPDSALAGKSYHAENFDVNLDILKDGSMWVTETIVFRFDGGPFTYVFRDLSTTRTDGIVEISASLDGQPLQVGNSNGLFEVTPGNPIKVKWNFSPITDTSRIYTLKYHVLGVIRKLDADTLVWRAIPESHAYSIDDSSISLHYPVESVLLNQPTTGKITSNITLGDHTVNLHVAGISDDTPVDVTARFQSGSVTNAVPGWQAGDAQRGRLVSQAIPFTAASGLLVLLGGVAILVAWDRSHSRQETLDSVSAFRRTSPPGQEPPAIAAALVNARHGSIEASLLSTLFDLARRGIVNIEERQKRVLWMRESSYSITRQPGSVSLRPHERELLSIIFETKEGPRDSAWFNEVGNALSLNHRRLTDVIKQELESSGFIDAAREKQRKALMIFSIPIFSLGILILAFGLMWTSLAGDSLSTQSLLMPMMTASSGFSLFVIGMVVLGYGTSRSPLTDHADQIALNWKSFFDYLKNITRGKEAIVRPDTFDLYLPFSAAFGMVEAWGRFFAKNYQAQVPAWFRPLDDSSADFSTFITMLSASDSSTDAGAGGAAGAGASGGGSSGAG